MAHRVDAPNNNGGLFRDKDTGGGITGTSLKSKWLNMMQEELVGVVEAASIVLDDADDAQLLEALQSGLVTPKMRGGASNDILGEIPSGSNIFRMKQLGSGKSMNVHVVSANGQDAAIRLIEGGGSDDGWTIAVDDADGKLRFASAADADEDGGGTFTAQAWFDQSGPMFLRDGWNHSASGFTRLNNGTILQWGVYTGGLSSSSSGTIAFPRSFPTGCRSVMTTINASAAGGQLWVAVSDLQAGSFDWVSQYHNTGGSAPGFFWLAIGY